MRTWWKQLVPYLLLLSLAGNIYLSAQIYNQQRELNLVTWGNSVDTFWKYINWARLDIGPADTRPGITSLQVALDDLESLRSLPGFDQRIANADMRTLEEFLRYADTASVLAAKEQAATGSLSAETNQRLAKIKQGLEWILRHQTDTNRAKVSRNPWNHAEWRALWADLAAGLREMNLLPLPA